MKNETPKSKYSIHAKHAKDGEDESNTTLIINAGGIYIRAGFRRTSYNPKVTGIPSVSFNDNLNKIYFGSFIITFNDEKTYKIKKAILTRLKDNPPKVIHRKISPYP